MQIHLNYTFKYLARRFEMHCNLLCMMNEIFERANNHQSTYSVQCTQQMELILINQEVAVEDMDFFDSLLF